MDMRRYDEITIYRRVRKAGLLFRVSDPALLAVVVARIQGAIPSCVTAFDWVGGMRLPCVHRLGGSESELYFELRHWLAQEGWEPVYDNALGLESASTSGYHECRLRRPIDITPPLADAPAQPSAHPRTLAVHLRRLAAQHKAGALDDTQYQAAKRKLYGA